MVSILLQLVSSLYLVSLSHGFTTAPIVTKKGSTLFASSPSPSSSSDDDLFKAGLFCDESSKDLAVKLASTKIRKLSDLGWRETTKRGIDTTLSQRKSSIRPKLWCWGGSKELPIQEKANYSPDNPNCPEPWLGLQAFYSLVGDDSAAADLIFVSLAGGRAFVERDVAESVLNRWWQQPKNKQQFDRHSFEQTVVSGQIDFVTSWTFFIGILLAAGCGIAFPENPLQLALVRAIDTVL